MEKKKIEEKIKEQGESLRRIGERVRKLQGEGKRIQNQLVQAIDEGKIVQGGIRALQELLNDEGTGTTQETLSPEDDTSPDDNAPSGERPEETKEDVSGQQTTPAVQPDS